MENVRVNEARRRWSVLSVGQSSWTPERLTEEDALEDLEVLLDAGVNAVLWKTAPLVWD
jgi:hypothetical protein